MPGKPRLLTDEQIEKARKLVEEGYLIKDVATRFGVTTERLNAYGIKRPVNSTTRITNSMKASRSGAMTTYHRRRAVRQTGHRIPRGGSARSQR